MLSVENLSFRYPKNPANTINKLSFSINKAEVFGFLGPSGSGKSTTQKILYKLLPGYEGEVFFKEKKLQDWGRDFYESIGVSFELPNHYLKLSAYENLEFFSAFYKGQNENKNRINELLEKVGLQQDAHKRVSEFSKGMKMRLNFVRAILHKPEFLFLDEPTSGLDPINAKIIKDIIKELKAEGTTIFLTTHNMFDAEQLCDKVALLHQGEIKTLDAPSVLKIKHGRAKVKVGLKEGGGERTFDLDRLGENADFLEIVKQNRIQTIHSEEATLEDVFIKITGERLV